jgi:hypothetical protein
MTYPTLMRLVISFALNDSQCLRISELAFTRRPPAPTRHHLLFSHADNVPARLFDLAYILYAKHQQPKYHSFEIPKRGGGTRQISAPMPDLKLVQQRLSDLLQDCVEEINQAYSRKDQLAQPADIGEVGGDGIELLEYFCRPRHPRMIHQRQRDSSGPQQIRQPGVYPRFIPHFEREFAPRGQTPEKRLQPPQKFA